MLRFHLNFSKMHAIPTGGVISLPASQGEEFV